MRKKKYASGRTRSMAMHPSNFQRESPEWLQVSKFYWVQVIKSDRGSLSLLTITLFFILVLSSFVILNTSSAFLAKRELIQAGEIAITRASQNLDLNRYYLEDSNSSRVPVDCGAAYESFNNEIHENSVRGKAIELVQWSCAGDSPSVTIQSEIPQLLKMPFLSFSNSNTSTITITATIGATSTVRSTP